MLSSIIAAWADISDTLASGDPAVSEGMAWNVTGIVRNLNIGYFWMLVNCLASAAYVRVIASYYCGRRHAVYPEMTMLIMSMSTTYV